MKNYLPSLQKDTKDTILWMTTSFICLSLSFLVYDNIYPTQVTLVDIVEKQSSGYKMFQVEVTGLESAPRGAAIHFTNGIISDKSNTAISFDGNNAIISTIYQEIPAEFSTFENTLEFELKGITINGWFIPLDDAKCYGIACTKHNLYGDITTDGLMRENVMIGVFIGIPIICAIIIHCAGYEKKKNIIKQ